ncbi:hypothetical protein B566_EDAN002214, partial [Ephemera danica]
MLENDLAWQNTQSAAIKCDSDIIDNQITDDDSSTEAMDVDTEKIRKEQTNFISDGSMMSYITQHTKPPISAPRQTQCDVGGAQEALMHETKEKMYSELPSIKESADHFVLYDAPRVNTSEQDLISFDCDMKFEDDFCVLMPYTNFYKQPDANDRFRLRSGLIKDAYKTPENINTVKKLQKAIVSYNHPLGTQWDFSLLKQFEIEDEHRILRELLPKIVKLALDLPNLLTRPLPILKRGKTQQLSLTQKQIASLLANAFLCTFPKRSTFNETMKYLAPINFNSLFEMPTQSARQSSQMQKLHCLIHYFHRQTGQGAERYSEYSGYANTFQWQGDYKDSTMKDSNQRRNCSILAIDAQNFPNKDIQFTPKAINRELFKAFVGFYSPEGSPLSIATGNWGCGIFGGDPHLKAVLQMMAAAMCGRRLIYHTLGDKTLSQDIQEFNEFAFRAKITV